MNDVQLGAHAKLIRGVTFKPADKCEPQDENAVVCMRTKNVQATLDESDLIAIPRSLVKNPEKIVSPGDILVSSANSWNLVGKCCQVRTLRYPSTAGGFISILRPTTGELDSGYLYRWFSSVDIQRRLRSFSNQTTNISNLDHKRAMKLSIPLPPLAEQRRIAGILDAADALRAKRRESLAQLDTLLQSTFVDMFGDPNREGSKGRIETHPVKMGDLTRIRTGKLDANAADEDGTHPFFTCAARTLRINKAAFDAKAILVAGNGALNVKYYEGKFNAYQRTYVIESDDEARLHSRFLHIFLDLYVSELRKKAIGGVIKYIKLPYLKDAMVELPDLESQERFAAVVESVEQHKARQTAHLAELDTLFASLQSRAFSGEL